MNDLLLEKEASNFRFKQGISNNDAIRFKSLLQKANVISVFAPLSDSFSGMAVKNIANNNTTCFILINSNQSIGKQHFTICHELYHLYIQLDFSSQVCITGKFDKNADKNEYYADIFASYLLLPTDGILANIPNEELSTKKISLKTILFIENLYSCSRRALLYRLKKLKLITQSEYDNYTVNIIKGALENGYQTDLYKAGNNNVVIGDYGNLAKELFDKDKISQAHYYSLLIDLGIDLSKLNDMEDGEA